MFLLIRMWVIRIVLIEIYLLVQKSSLSDIAMKFYEAKKAKKGQIWQFSAKIGMPNLRSHYLNIVQLSGTSRSGSWKRFEVNRITTAKTIDKKPSCRRWLPWLLLQYCTYLTCMVVTRQMTRVPKARVLIWSVTKYLLHGKHTYYAVHFQPFSAKLVNACSHNRII